MQPIQDSPTVQLNCPALTGQKRTRSTSYHGQLEHQPNPNSTSHNHQSQLADQKRPRPNPRMTRSTNAMATVQCKPNSSLTPQPTSTPDVLQRAVEELQIPSHFSYETSTIDLTDITESPSTNSPESNQQSFKVTNAITPIQMQNTRATTQKGKIPRKKLPVTVAEELHKLLDSTGLPSDRRTRTHPSGMRPGILKVKKGQTLSKVPIPGFHLIHKSRTFKPMNETIHVQTSGIPQGVVPNVTSDRTGRITVKYRFSIANWKKTKHVYDTSHYIHF